MTPPSTFTIAYESYLAQLYNVLTVLALVALALVICWHLAPRVLGRRWELYAPWYLAWCGAVYASFFVFAFAR